MCSLKITASSSYVLPCSLRLSLDSKLAKYKTMSLAFAPKPTSPQAMAFLEYPNAQFSWNSLSVRLLYVLWLSKCKDDCSMCYFERSRSIQIQLLGSLCFCLNSKYLSEKTMSSSSGPKFLSITSNGVSVLVIPPPHGFFFSVRIFYLLWLSDFPQAATMLLQNDDCRGSCPALSALST